MRLSISLAVLLLGAVPALAGPLEDGLAAYKARAFDKAVQLLRPLADKGNPEAQEKIGRLYERGMGVPKDFTQAEYWYRKAAEQGNPAAQARLGFMYRIGEGVTRDPKQAARWYAMGAAKGNPLAEVGLGFMSMEGIGTPADFGAAAGWFDKAANQGDASAMLALAALYERGKGVAKSDVQALKWTILAATDDGEYEQELFDRAKRLRNEMSDRMPPDQVGEAERAARSWQANQLKR
ncbi:MAG: tetratricopeptide repeat protein [Rhodospirillaceae bacterium]